jgi:hypothetical protein
MRNENDVTQLLTEVLTEAGEGFTFDEKAIRTEYEKRRTQATPLSVQVLSILGGILSTGAIIGFFAMEGILDSKAAMIFFGIGFIIAAVGLNRTHEKPLLDTANVAFFIVGFFFLGLSIDSVVPICIIFIVIAFIVLFVVQNLILSFLSVLLINGCIATLIIESGSVDLMYIYITILITLVNYLFYNEAKLTTRSPKMCQLYRPLRIAVLLSLLGLLLSTVLQFHWVGRSYMALLPSAAGIWTIVFLVSYIISLLGVEDAKYKWIIYAVVLLLLLPTVLFPSLAVSLMIILLSFRFNYKTGFALGIVAFIYSVGQYYYDLNLTLLVKSILMIASGILFILLFLFTRHKLTSK